MNIKVSLLAGVHNKVIRSQFLRRDLPQFREKQNLIQCQGLTVKKREAVDMSSVLCRSGIASVHTDQFLRDSGTRWAGELVVEAHQGTCFGHFLSPLSQGRECALEHLVSQI